MLNHWDNLNRAVERLCRFLHLELAYLLGFIDKDILIMQGPTLLLSMVQYLPTLMPMPLLPNLFTVKALADVFRPYGIKVFFLPNSALSRQVVLKLPTR
jgi:hypothetical protein